MVVNQTIVEHSVNLVDPQTNELIPFLHTGRWHQEDTENDSSKVSQVEHIM